jgi:hypothetical protein
MQTQAQTEHTVYTTQGDPLDSGSLLAEVRYWDRLIEAERGRSKDEVLARLEEHRAWALVRLLNLVGSEPPRMTEPWRGRLGA